MGRPWNCSRTMNRIDIPSSCITAWPARFRWQVSTSWRSALAAAAGLRLSNAITQPEHLTGVDLSPKAVRFCRDQYRQEGLSFLPGDAESLPLDHKSFDAVLNLE